MREDSFVGIKHFTPREFGCKCGAPDCIYNDDGEIARAIDRKLIVVLENLRVAVGFPLTINSGLRCAQHEVEKIKKRPGSHFHGMAADIRMPQGERRQLELNAGVAERSAVRGGKIEGVGIASGFFHTDVGHPHMARPAFFHYKF